MKEQKLFRRYGVSLALATVGGFLEAYTYVTRDGVFANAQTGNIARMGLNLAQGNILLTLRYLIPVIAFMAGVTLSLQLRRLRQDWERVILLLEIALLFLVGLIPTGSLNMLATVTVSFVCALQVESFRKFGENAFASTMCTGNLRIATEHLNRYFADKSRTELNTALQYYGIDLVFACAVLVGYWVTRAFGVRAVWFPILIPAALLILLRREEVR
jgi:uncharacterized membrane protein YoaK (UPF0700 family)